MTYPSFSLGADHGGFALKEAVKAHLIAQNIHVVDCGVETSSRSVDYPDFAEKVARNIMEKRSNWGILVCTSGLGMSMAANKFDGIRAALPHNEDAVLFSRKHNKANVLCLGQKYTTFYMACRFVDIFIRTDFEGGRHEKRVEKIQLLQGGNS